MFGRTRGEGALTKQQFVDNCLLPDDIHKFETALEEAKRTGGNFDVMCRIKRQDGSRRWLRINGKFAAPIEGSALRFTGVVADISLGKQLERRAARIAQRQATIQEKERRNIAQELHDLTVQHLVAASLSLMTLRPATPLRGEEVGLWRNLEMSLDEAVKELRTFSYMLHPPALRARTLRSILEEYLAGLASRSGLNTRLRLNSQGREAVAPDKAFAVSHCPSCSGQRLPPRISNPNHCRASLDRSWIAFGDNRQWTRPRERHTTSARSRPTWNQGTSGGGRGQVSNCPRKAPRHDDSCCDPCRLCGRVRQHPALPQARIAAP